MNAAPLDLLVGGAGPAGLTLALQAAAHGASVRVVERRADPARPSRALVVHPRTLEVLRPLGVTDELLARGDPAPAIRLHLGRREVEARLGAFPLEDTAFPFLLFVSQAAVEEVLAGALARQGVEVERGVELTDVADCTGTAVARIRRGSVAEFVDCRYLAGCDGAASRVRAELGVAWRGAPYREEVVLADLELAGGLAAGQSHAAAARSGVVFVFALGEGAPWRLLATRPAGPDRGRPGQPLEPVRSEELQAILDGAGLDAAVTAVRWSARVPLEHRLASRYRLGPAFLVGDAAHVHSPAGGQGMNTGIQDAANLGWKLAFAAAAPAGDPAADALLATYEAERRPVGRRVLALTHLLFWAEAGQDPVASSVRGSLVPLAAPTVPFLLRRRRVLGAGVRVLSQLGLRYRHSPLSVDGVHPRHGAPGPGPGDRLPDATVTVDGRRRELHELLAHPGVHLLLERDTPPAGGLAVPPGVAVHRLTDRPGRGALLVRPDGYIGLRSATGDPVEIGAWLARAALTGASRAPWVGPSPPLA
jgi:2-polyprenyl-6-methoxyphenol hydroxylase-like FAD-dependent oxidoreductase